MRKHSPRKWLHAILDLLPVILIPVFMIYSHRHVLTETKDVDIQYKYQSNEVNSVDDLVEGNIYHCDTMTFIDDEYNVSYEFTLYIYDFESIQFENYVTDELMLDEYSNIGYLDVPLKIMYTFDNQNDNYNFSIDVTLGSDTFYWFFQLEDGYPIIKNFDFYYLNTTGDFKNYLSYGLANNQSFDNNFALPQYTDNRVVESVTVEDTNTDIMSVFTDNLYTTVDNYFNFNQVFNFQDLQDWFATNMFGGTMPKMAVVVYDIIVYEFIMDIIFIIYGVFMFIIDCAEFMLEKPFDKMRGR